MHAEAGVSPMFVLEAAPAFGAVATTGKGGEGDCGEGDGPAAAPPASPFGKFAVSGGRLGVGAAGAAQVLLHPESNEGVAKPETTPLHLACEHNHDACVMLLLRAEAIDICKKDVQGRTARDIALAKGFNDVLHAFAEFD